MSWFRREQAPAWSGFRLQKDYRKFEEAMTERLRVRGVKARVSEGMVHAQDLEFNGMGLENIARLCAATDRKHWPTLLDGHLETMARGRHEAMELNEYIGDYSRVKKLLKPRVWPEHYLETAGAENLVYRVDIPGTITCLCFDLPSTVVNISPSHSRAWKKKKTELFSAALANLRRDNPIEVTMQDPEELGPVYTISGAHYFVPSHAQDLLNKKKYKGRFGTLVGIPVRETLILYPVQDERVVSAISLLIPNITRMAARNPGFVSDGLYWYDGKKFQVIDYELKDEKLDITPSRAIARLLKSAAG